MTAALADDTDPTAPYMKRALISGTRKAGKPVDLSDVDATVVERLIDRDIPFSTKTSSRAERWLAVRILVAARQRETSADTDDSPTYAARVLGMTDRTVYRWLSCPPVGQPHDVDRALLRQLLICRTRRTRHVVGRVTGAEHDLRKRAMMRAAPAPGPPWAG